MSRRLHTSVNQHERWRGSECLNLIPSENITSPAVRALLGSDLGHRYTARDSYYMGTKYLDEIEAVCEELAKRVFGCKYADVRPLSGHHCNMIATTSFTRASDSVLSVSPRDGGYPGLSHEGLGKILHLKNLYFPFDSDRMNIKEREATDLIKKEKPRLITFGASFILFPHPVAQLLKSSTEAVNIYDGSHVLGLIAGNEFQDPLREGCDLLIGSTHKSFFGPQGGLILTNNDEIWQKLVGNIHPGLVDNIHWNRIAGLAHSLLEFLRYGKAYAKQVVTNAKYLGRTLSELHLPLKAASQGFTRSHQLILDLADDGERFRLAHALEEAGIIVDRGIRLGTSEVTRHGMKEEQMSVVANLISDIFRRRSRSEQVARAVKKLVREFSTVEYSLDRPG